MSTLDKKTTLTSVEEDILDSLARNDKGVIELIYNNYGPMLMNVIFRVLKDEALAQDVFQEVIIKIWRKGHYYNANKGSLYTWLVSVCKNAAIDKTRSRVYKQKQQTHGSETIASVGEEMKTELHTEHEYLYELVKQLPENQKLLVDMAFFQGYTHEEIAKKLDMPLGTVKTRIRTAIKQLRKVLKA